KEPDDPAPHHQSRRGGGAAAPGREQARRPIGAAPAPTGQRYRGRAPYRAAATGGTVVSGIAAAMALVLGIVTDWDGRPIAGARVLYTRTPAAMPDIAQLTEADGVFALPAPNHGTYRLGVAADGYRASETEVDIAADTVSLIVRLDRPERPPE